jgi:pimeloyl-ACP methyl ester carboxylesterase
MSRPGRRLLRQLVRRQLPGAQVGGQATATSREFPVAGADGSPIPVTDEGQGPAVLLLHAGSADRSSWAGVAAALAVRFRVLRFDRWTYRGGHAGTSPAGADAMAAVLPRLDSMVVLDGQGHLANLRAPGEVAQVIAAFADRLAR